MTLDLARIIESKRVYRRKLAALPIAEKLRMLDAMRERATTLRQSKVVSAPSFPNSGLGMPTLGNSVPIPDAAQRNGVPQKEDVPKPEFGNEGEAIE